VEGVAVVSSLPMSGSCHGVWPAVLVDLLLWMIVRTAVGRVGFVVCDHGMACASRIARSYGHPHQIPPKESDSNPRISHEGVRDRA